MKKLALLPLLLLSLLLSAPAWADAYSFPGGIPSVVGNSGLPFVVLSGNGSTVGNMGNNGAVSSLTAVPSAYANAYCYVPANAIAAGSTAGWYYCTFGSTTAATLFNNTYDTTACGTPTIPSSPTAFSTTGPGFFTQTTGSYLPAYCVNIAANSMGLNGSVAIQAEMTNNNSANTKLTEILFGGAVVCFPSNTTNTSYSIGARIINRGRVDRQVNMTGPSCLFGASANPPGFASISTASAVKIVFQLQLATAGADFAVLEGAGLVLNPGVQ